VKHISYGAAPGQELTGEHDQYERSAHLISEISRWKDRNLHAGSLPHHLSSQVAQVERHEHAVRFIIETPEQEKWLNDIRRQVNADSVARGVRRRSELTLADYIEREIAPRYSAMEPGLFDVVDKLRACRQKGVVGVRPDGRHLVMWDEKCRLGKLCPDEAREEQKRLAEKYVPAIEKFIKASHAHTVQYAVMTEKNVPAEELHEAKRRQYAKLAKMLRRKVMRAVKGALVVQEDPLAIDGESWNVHLNVILLVDKRINFDWGEVREQWGGNIEFKSAKKMEEITRKRLQRKGMDVSNMSSVTVLTHAVMELCKYSAKITAGEEEKNTKGNRKQAPVMTEWAPERWYEWWRANKGFRRTRSYGVLYRLDEDDSDREDFSDVVWLGSVRFNGTQYECSIDLILADKSANLRLSGTGNNSQIDVVPPDGPPPGGPPPPPDWDYDPTIQ